MLCFSGIGFCTLLSLDFELVDSQLHLLPGSSTICGDIQVENDGILEVDESLNVILSSSNERVVITIPSSTVIIIDTVSYSSSLKVLVFNSFGEFFSKTVITPEAAEESITMFNHIVGTVMSSSLSTEGQVAVLESVGRTFMSFVNLSSSGKFNISENVSLYVFFIQ